MSTISQYSLIWDQTSSQMPQKQLIYFITLAFLSPSAIFLIFAFKAAYFATPESEVL